jgi:hypothetical protein
MYIYYLFVLKAAHACNANRRKRRMHKCIQAHKRTDAPKICPQDRKHIKHKYNYIILKVWLITSSGS